MAELLRRLPEFRPEYDDAADFWGGDPAPGLFRYLMGALGRFYMDRARSDPDLRRRYWDAVELMAADDHVDGAVQDSLIEWFAWGNHDEMEALLDAGPLHGPATAAMVEGFKGDWPDGSPSELRLMAERRAAGVPDPYVFESVVIARDVPDVWDHLADPANHPDGWELERSTELRFLVFGRGERRTSYELAGHGASQTRVHLQIDLPSGASRLARLRLRRRARRELRTLRTRLE